MDAGWHPDPTGRFAHRYFDGSGWTDHVVDAAGVQSVAPLVIAPVRPGPPPPPTVPLPTPAPVHPANARPLWRKKRLLIPVALLAVIIGAAALTSGDDKDGAGEESTLASVGTSTTGSPTTLVAGAAASTTAVTPVTTAKPAATTTAKPAPTTTAAPAPTAPPRPSFGGGTKLVGKDIQPGRYIAKAKSSCYWERLSGTSGEFKDLIANDNSNGQVIVDILPTDVAFSSTRCSTFELYEKPAAPANTITEGNWIVGEQVEPGTYRASPTGSCYWERNADATGNGDIRANDNVQGSAVVTLKAGDVFTSNRCGTWTKA